MNTNTAQKNIPSEDGTSYCELIGPIARHFWGDPNEQLSKPSELRFGSHGSKSVDLEKNLFFDHEADEGGGVIKLVQYGTASKNAARRISGWSKTDSSAMTAPALQPGAKSCKS